MPLRKKRHNKKYLVYAILLVLFVGMIVSFSNSPVFTEIVLYP